ncbi:MAG: archease, partial [Chloroflexi bacterium]|nr:archease [Chloroflexota bacterium]
MEAEGWFEETAHTADLALRLQAATLPGLFAAAARGMFSLMADLTPVQPRVKRALEVTGLDAEMLLVEWLNELLYLHEREG